MPDLVMKLNDLAAVLEDELVRKRASSYEHKSGRGETDTAREVLRTLSALEIILEDLQGSFRATAEAHKASHDATFFRKV